MIHPLAPFPMTPHVWPRYATSYAQSVLQYLAEATWDRLYHSHQLGLSVREETITDINLLELVRLRLPGLRVYKAKGQDEPTKGFDWEWWIGSRKNGYWRYSIQAKKLELKTGRYDHIRHPAGKVQPKQIDILESFAIAQNSIPLYCFYNAEPTATRQQHWHCALPYVQQQLGCTLAPLALIRKHHNKLSLKRTFELIHKDTAVVPWHCIVCPGTSTSGQRRNRFAPEAYEPELVRELPVVLREGANEQFTVDLPEDLYGSELGGKPRWIMVIETEADGGQDRMPLEE